MDEGLDGATDFSTLYYILSYSPGTKAQTCMWTQDMSAYPSQRCALVGVYYVVVVVRPTEEGEWI